MTPEKWQELQQVFEQALALPLNERQAFLKNYCQGDATLLDELTRMIAQANNDKSSLTQIIEQTVEQVLETQLLTGKTLGAFELTQRIGMGGMGEVYRAKRVDGEFEQQVAVKIIRSGYINNDINLRFQTERQILAKLNHPNIARVIDGGRFDGERLYLAMEFVDGIPIDVYCQQQQLSKAQKLRLFLKVCAAVSSAHQNRIIHCDIKPSNILVSENGEPHLLDFGIATFIDIQPDEQNDTTSNNSVNAVTWDYASPEQQAGEGLSTATDIYALGILLYELLLEKRPEINQQRPSIEKFADLVNIDLQMIVNKALQFTPADRYSSIDKLADDIQFHLNKLPISLRANQRGYLFSRFLQRNKTIAAATFLTVLLLSGFSYREYQLRIVAQLAQVKAQHESKKSQQVISFLTNIFKISDPDHAKGNTVTAREILDKGRDNISENLKNQPAIHTDLLLTIANVYENLGLYHDAKKVYNQGLQLAKDNFPNDLALQLNFINRLAFTNISLSQFSEAEKQLQLALTYDLPQEHPVFASIFNHLGLLRNKQGNTAESITLFKKSLKIRQQHSTAEKGNTFRIQHNLANSYIDIGQYKNADHLLAQVLTDKQQAYGKRHQSYIRTLTSYVNLAQYQGTNKNTLTLAQEALFLAQEVLNENHPDVINSLNTVANVLHDQGNYKQAEQHYKQLLELDRKYTGEDTISYSVSLNNLASLYKDMQSYDRAEPLFQQSLTLRKKLYKSNNPRVANAFANLGQLLNLTKRYDESMILNQQALDILQKSDNPIPYLVSTTKMKLAQTFLGQNNPQKSAEMLQQVSIILTKNFKPQHKLFAELYLQQAKLNAYKGNTQKAIVLLKKTLEIQSKRLGTAHPLLAEYKVQLAQWHATQKQWYKAKKLIEKNLPSLTKHLYEYAPALQQAKALLKQIEIELSMAASHKTT
ncbi:serine/threonine-protein kinase [Cognaticolwellia mytili]|uniref:serine/threonine-protein kinase n=1 Tax=Cognaticolwellia mytili TaxID=1888913 RepID=UPI000A16E2DA|nr:serine/threonine-protein kinase [Cognaticolwellia mytili]